MGSTQQAWLPEWREHMSIGTPDVEYISRFDVIASERVLHWNRANDFTSSITASLCLTISLVVGHDRKQRRNNLANIKLDNIYPKEP